MVITGGNGTSQVTEILVLGGNGGQVQVHVQDRQDDDTPSILRPVRIESILGK